MRITTSYILIHVGSATLFGDPNERVQLTPDTFGLLLPVKNSDPQFEMIFDTSSNDSFFRADQSKNPDLRRIAGNIQSQLGVNTHWIDFLVNGAPILPDSVLGVAGFGGNALGAMPFALVGTPIGVVEYVYQPNYNELVQYCAYNKLRRAPLDISELASSGRWIIPGFIGIAGSDSVNVRLELATGASGFEFPPTVYAKLVHFLRNKGIGLKQADGIYNEFLSCRDCHEQLTRVFPQVIFGRPYANSLLDLDDIVELHAGGLLILAIKPSLEENIVRIGGVGIKRLIAMFDRPNSELHLCTRREFSNNP